MVEKKFLQGLGLWNVYFICKFALAYFGYLTLNPLANAVLLAFLLLPFDRKVVRILQTVVGLIAGFVLIYSESWLPGLDSITSNTQNIAGFSFNYIMQLAIDFVNLKMVAWGLLILFAYFLLRRWIRVTVLTVGYFAVLALQPMLAAWHAQEQAVIPTNGAMAVPEQTVDSTAVVAEPTPGNPETITSETIAKWYTAFLEYEKERRAAFPQGIPAKDTPFDIVLLNVCSLSNDDLIASEELAQHPVFDQFNIRFDRFNSATSYSGPATLRLLNAMCGQVDHDTLYDERRPECEIMNRLDQLGFKQHMFFDHHGQYDNYLQTMRDKAGLTAPLESSKKYPVRYVAFDDEPISDDLAVMRDWLRTLNRDKDVKRTVTLFNFIALHDGNRLPRQSRWEAFKPRLKVFLDDLQRIIREIERSGRKVMLVVVPEHGAAVRGDRVQTARLRDIPSMRITQVPTMVKFIGIKNMPQETIHVTGNTSYLAMAELIGKVIESNYFSVDGGSIPLQELIQDLPETNPVSENGQSVVLTYKGQDYIRRNKGEWVVYPTDR